MVAPPLLDDNPPDHDVDVEEEERMFEKEKCILTVAMDLSPTKKYFQFVFLASCVTLEHL